MGSSLGHEVLHQEERLQKKNRIISLLQEVDDAQTDLDNAFHGPAVWAAMDRLSKSRQALRFCLEEEDYI